MRDDDALDNNPEIARSALEAIHSQVFGWTLSRCNYDQQAAEDLMQQAYIELLTGRARFDNRSSLKTFVFSVVQNLTRSRFRRLAARFRLAEQYAATMPAAETENRELAADSELWTFVKSLPERQRDVIELVFCRDLTIEEAARVMGVTTGTGRAHYDRAKKALRKKLGDDYAV